MKLCCHKYGGLCIFIGITYVINFFGIVSDTQHSNSSFQIIKSPTVKSSNVKKHIQQLKSSLYKLHRNR